MRYQVGVLILCTLGKMSNGQLTLPPELLKSSDVQAFP
jgi:hypothetical protein